MSEYVACKYLLEAG